MAPLSRDSVEVANPTAEAAVSPAGGATKTSGHLRQDALSLEVPVKVHGSRVTEVVRGVTPHTEPFEEQTTTMIIFPQGGVLRMSTSVNVGQMLVLTNSTTRQDAICRVVKVRTFTNMQGYVEVEFTHPQPTYWGVHFPKERGAAPAKPEAAPSTPAAPATPAGCLVPPHEEVKPRPVADVSWAPAKAMPPATAAVTPAASVTDVPKAAASVIPAAPATTPPKPYVVPSKPASSFIGIGSQEEVQPAAAATVTTKPAAPVAPPEIKEVPRVREIKKEAAAPVASVSAPSAPAADTDTAATDFPSLSITELLGDSDSPSEQAAAEVGREAEERVAAPAPAAKSDAAATTDAVDAVSASAAAPEVFGSRFDASARTAASDGPKGSPKWLLPVAAVAVLVAVAAGGAFYLRSQRSAAPAAASVPATASSPAASAAVRSAQPATSASAQPAAEPPSAAAVRNAIVAPHGNNVAPANKPAGPAPAQPAAPRSSNASAGAPPAPEPSKVTGTMVAEALNTHPVTAQRSTSDQNVEAPPVESESSSESAGVALPSILSPSDGPAAPEVKPEPEPKAATPVRVGGSVREPKLTYSVPPVYPVIAKEAHIQGDVVVKATIDQKGNVIHTEIISGPAMLRGAAIEALRRWKYTPSMLDGEPITVQMEVTLKFHM